MGIFNSVLVNSPKRSVFDLSYNKKYTCKFGQLIPTQCDEVVPGDVVSLGNTTICRLTPLNAPVLDELIIKSESFFVPYRLLWPDFEKFITGVDNSLKWDKNDPPEFEAPIPCKVIRPRKQLQYASNHPLKYEWKSCKVGSLQDYFGFPVNLYDNTSNFKSDSELSVNAWPWLAYYKIWNDYYRDENLEDEIDILSLFKDYRATKDLVVVNSINEGNPLCRSWKKDYFTSALPFRQKGTSPALPIYGTAFADFTKSFSTSYANSDDLNANLYYNGYSSSDQEALGYRQFTPLQSGSVLPGEQIYANPYTLGIADNGSFKVVSPRWLPEYHTSPTTGMTNYFDNVVRGENFTEGVEASALSALNKNIINSSSLASVNIAQLRLIMQIQRWLELNARTGSGRYTEFLRAHFGVAPRDERLDRAEWIGSTKQSIVVSEVLQTAQTTESGETRGSVDNSLGAMGGHGLSVAGNKVGVYRVKEYGLIMTLTSIYPKPSYQQGINRQWLRTTKYDFFFPEFTGLSEKNVLDKEIYVDSETPSDLDNETEWGYQGMYDEMRYKPNQICGHFRSNYDPDEQELIQTGAQLPYSLDYWHLGRFFGSKPELNKDFINIDESGEQLNRIFVVPSEDYCLVDYQNYIKAYRPLPYYAIPGGI